MRKPQVCRSLLHCNMLSRKQKLLRGDLSIVPTQVTHRSRDSFRMPLRDKAHRIAPFTEILKYSKAVVVTRRVLYEDHSYVLPACTAPKIHLKLVLLFIFGVYQCDIYGVHPKLITQPGYS